MHSFQTACRAFVTNDYDQMAGSIAFAVLLSIFPFLIFAVSLTGAVIGEARAAQAIDVLFEFAPLYLAQTIEPVAREVLSSTPGPLTFFVLLSIYAAMRAVDTLARAFDRVYGGTRKNSWVWRKFKSLCIVFGTAIVSVILGIAIPLAPLIFLILPEPWRPGDLMDTAGLRYLIGTLVMFAFLWVLHRVLPANHARGTAVWPGALLSTVLWVMLATGFSLYLAFSNTYSLTYGALAGIVITILFLYLSAAIVLFGAEVNAALRTERQD